MTAETMSGEETSAAVPTTGPLETERLVGRFFLVSAAFLVLGLVLLAIAALQLVTPGFLEGVGFLSYGRVYPMALHSLLYGWLTIGFLGLGLMVVRRIAAGGGAAGRTAEAGLGLVAVGFIAGLVGIGVGLSEGRRYVEAPLWADAVVLVGLVLLAAVVTRTARSSEASTPALWFVVAANWWLVLSHAVGNIPAIAGVNATIQSSFYEAALFGLWFAAAGIGVAYFVVPRLAGRDASRATRLAVLGFWSLAFVWASSGPRNLVYGAAPDWLETLGAIFSIGLLVPVIVVFADFVATVRGRWSEIAEPVSMRFVMTGAVLLAVLALQNLVMALRSSSAVTQFTQWITAYEDLALFGAFGMLLFGGIYHAMPAVLGRGVRRGQAAWHYGLTLLGLGLMLAPMWIGGLQQGFTWAAGANDDAFAGFGDAFINSVAPFDGHYVVRLVGLLIFLGGQEFFVLNLFSKRGDLPAPVSDVSDEDLDDELVAERPIGFRRLTVGAVGMFAVAALLVWLLPSLERDHREGTLRGDTVRDYAAGSVKADGRQIYLSEGCWYCHTQEVRPIIPDVGLGPVSAAGDYVHEVPALRGVQRIGPDLMHAGSREPTDSVLWVVEFLEDPGSVHPWTKQPSYAHLSDADLQAVATYIAGLD